GLWAFELSQPLAHGEHTFTVVSAGVSSDPFTLNIDGASPQPDPVKPSIDTVFDSFGDTGDIPNGGTTDDAKPTLVGSSTPNAYIRIYDNGTFIGHTYADS
ncbi:hypothetical protein KIN13_15605, partial [Vibrio cholerae]